MNPSKMPAPKFLKILGVIGEMLERGEQPLPDIRKKLEELRYTNNQIVTVFDALRNGHVRGVCVRVRKDRSMIYWSMDIPYSAS